MIHDDGSVYIVDFDRAVESGSEERRKEERKQLLYALDEHKSDTKKTLKRMGSGGAP